MLSIPSPPDIEASLIDIFQDITRNTSYIHLQNACNQAFDLAEHSIQSPHLIKDIQHMFSTVDPQQFDDFIHLLHITLFIRSLDKGTYIATPEHISTTPVTEAMDTLLRQCSVEQALDLLPFCMIDVLTAHPVDMDRGLIVNFKRKIEFTHRTWLLKKAAYTSLTDPHITLAARAELADLSQGMRDTLYQLMYTPNYRKVKIKPSSEQHNLSRAIKENEGHIIAHWPKLIVHVQCSLIEALILDINAPKTLLHLPRTTKTLDIFKQDAQLSQHPLFPRILDLNNQLRYELQIWRGDMDGNAFVTGETTALSLAYGRTCCFEGLSANDAVIRYKVKNEAFAALEKKAAAQLATIKQDGQPAWKRYIAERDAEHWDAIQTLSGLVYYRLVEMAEAAELYIRTKKDIALLHIGFTSESDFLEETKLLEQIEKTSHIRAGAWTQARQLVQLRGLSLGLPHCRKGEAFHLDLIHDLLPGFQDWALDEKKSKLHHFLSEKISPSTRSKVSFSEESQTLLDTYAIMMKTQANMTMIQSDSGSITQDIELSLLILKTVSHLISHTGDIVLLCEDKESMEQAVALMNEKEKNPLLFERTIMMCAGSDNQKKAGPFYAHYINSLFLKTAQKQGIRSFFGVGDSPLRSSTLSTPSTLKTFQPGSRKLYFFGENIFTYLSMIMANHIQHQALSLQQSSDEKEHEARLLELFATTLYTAYSHHITTRHSLHKRIQDISEIVTTYFSRPSKKYKTEGHILDQIRAIDSGRAQLILNTFDPQLAGLKEGLSHFHEKLRLLGISESETYHFFNHSPIGQSFLKTLAYFAAHLDDTLSPHPTDIRVVSAQDIRKVYTQLSGETLDSHTDPYLRLTRLLWTHICDKDDRHEHQAIAMMLFGSNWMI